MVTTRTKDIGVAVLAVAGWIIAAVCVWKSTPGIGWLDAGDFATAGFSLGVPHPTGFPLLTQLTHLAGLVQLGPWANRSVWLSAVSTGAAVAMVVAILFPERQRLPALLLAAAAVAGLPTLSIHARTTEVYALNLFLGASLLAILHWAARREAEPDLRHSMLLGIVLGVGLSHHALFRIWALPVVAVHLGQQSRGTRLRACLLGALGTMLGGLTNLYLPAAAGRGGMHNWGDPSTLHGFYRTLAGSEIREAFAGEMGRLSHLSDHVAAATAQLGGAIACLLIAGLVVLGLLQATRAKETMPPEIRAAAWMVGVEVAYGLLLNPMGLRDLQNLQWTALVAPLLALSMVARIRLSGRTSSVVLWSTAIALATLLSTTDDARAAGLGEDWASEDLAVISLGVAPAEAAVFPASDSLIAATLFVREAGDARPDLYLLGRSQASRGETLRYLDARQPYPLVAETGALEDLADLRPRFERLLGAAVPSHAVRWERQTRDADLPQGPRLMACWPLAAIGGEGCGAAGLTVADGQLDAGFGLYARRRAGADGTGYRNWLAEWHGAQGTQAASVGDWQRALPSFAGAAMLWESSSRFSNLAVALENLGRHDEALAALEHAWESYPRSAAVCRNARSLPDMPADRQVTWRLRCPDQPRE